MISLDDFQQLRRKVERLRHLAAKAAGARDQLMGELLEQFGCRTLAEAKLLLRKLSKDELREGRRYLKAKKAFERKWKHLLEGNDGLREVAGTRPPARGGIRPRGKGG